MKSTAIAHAGSPQLRRASMKRPERPCRPLSCDALTVPVDIWLFHESAMCFAQDCFAQDFTVKPICHRDMMVRIGMLQKHLSAVTRVRSLIRTKAIRFSSVNRLDLFTSSSFDVSAGFVSCSLEARAVHCSSV